MNTAKLIYTALNWDPDYGATEVPYLAECSACGAVVRDEERHTAWHGRIDGKEGSRDR